MMDTAKTEEEIHLARLPHAIVLMKQAIVWMDPQAKFAEKQNPTSEEFMSIADNLAMRLGRALQPPLDPRDYEEDEYVEEGGNWLFD